MIPRTKLQKRVCELSKTFPKPSDKKVDWAYNTLFPKYVYTTKKKYACLECGYEWQKGKMDPQKWTDALFDHQCPHCNATLKKVLPGRKRTEKFKNSFILVETYKEFQIIRCFEAHKQIKVGEEKNFWISEIARHWITEKGKHEVEARLKNWSYFYDHTYGDLILRSRNDKYLYGGRVYPHKKVLPIIRRNGFKGGTHELHPAWLFVSILRYPMFETMFKAKQWALIKKFDDNPFRYEKFEKWWPQIKLAIRHNYYVESGDLWFDYLDDLVYFKKDLHSPKYLFPEDLKKQHTKLSEKRLYIEKKKQADKDQKLLQKQKAKYFGLCFGEGDLIITVLKHIKEFYAEGEYMHHCVATPRYFHDPQSLIMSATYKGEKMETIEVNLQKLTISQCRGRFNNNSPHHSKIIKLVSEHMMLIKKVRDFNEKDLANPTKETMKLARELNLAV